MSFQITVRSAWSTLLVLDRQARRDTRKVSRFATHLYWALTSPKAVQIYRWLWQVFVIVCLVALALGASARAWCDATVESNLQPTATLAVEKPHTVEEDLADLKTDTVSIVPEAAQPPEAPSGTIDLHSLDPYALRKLCSERQIRWRNARPDGKHLRKAEMLFLLAASS